VLLGKRLWSLEIVEWKTAFIIIRHRSTEPELRLCVFSYECGDGVTSARWGTGILRAGTTAGCFRRVCGGREFFRPCRCDSSLRAGSGRPKATGSMKNGIADEVLSQRAPVACQGRNSGERLKGSESTTLTAKNLYGGRELGGASHTNEIRSPTMGTLLLPSEAFPG